MKLTTFLITSFAAAAAAAPAATAAQHAPPAKPATPALDWKTDDPTTASFLKTGNPGIRQAWDTHLCHGLGKLDCHLESATVKVIPQKYGHHVQLSGMQPDLRGSDSAHVFPGGHVERVPPTSAEGVAKEAEWRKNNPDAAMQEKRIGPGHLYTPDFSRKVPDNYKDLRGNLWKPPVAT